MQSSTPLAERMRPLSIEEYIGQKHLLGENGILKNAIKQKMIPSIIFWGPPGVGKTTLANIIANSLDRPFYSLSAISSGVKDVREVIQKAQSNDLFKSQAPIVFIDEIHRFSKSQQDSLLAAVEKGIIILIGATTENPSFEVISALLSRCQVLVLKEHSKEDLELLLDKAVREDELLQSKQITISEKEALISYSGGDARRLLNNLDTVISSSGKNIITNELVKNILSQSPSNYDKDGEQHYDIASAMIKSIRGSDPNAAIYWLARMIAGGEDPKFIARRLLISASEDIGNAHPQALSVALDCFKSVELIGYPECEIILSQAASYLASCPKSNASYKAIKTARQFVQETGNLPVPLHLRNAPTALMKQMNYGTDYKYSHDFPGHFVHQEYLPEKISGFKFYEPANNKFENNLRSYLKSIWKAKYDY
jgi:putative ATPase